MKATRSVDERMALAVRDVPVGDVRELDRLAKASGRSRSAQLRWLLSRALWGDRPDGERRP